MVIDTRPFLRNILSTVIDRSWYPVPVGHDVCPACQGTGMVLLTEAELKYSWNKDKTHRMCSNCGGQTMGGKALGYTRIDPATGKGCLHSVTGRNAGRCYTIYTCTKCKFSYDIDSGD
jgi:hypothetical protein